MAKEKQGHWQFLANLLGAESKSPPEESAETKETTETSVPTPTEPPRRAERPAPARKSQPADWGGIASDLGLAVPESVKTPDSVPIPDPVSPEVGESSPVARAEQDTEPSSPADSFSGLGADFPSTLPGFGVQRSAPPKDGYDTPPSEAVRDESDRAFPEQDILFEADVNLAGAVDLDDVVEEEEEEDEQPKTRRRRSRRRRRSSRDGQRDKEAVDVKAEPEPEPEPEPEVTDTEIASDEFGNESDDEEAPGESRRPRRGRRGRRRRSSSSREPQNVSHDTPDGDDDATQSERPPQSRRIKQPHDEGVQREPVLDDVSDISDDADSESTDRPRPRRHFTSWPEAIDHVISANLANRSKSNGQGGRRGRRPREGERNRGRGKREG